MSRRPADRPPTPTSTSASARRGPGVVSPQPDRGREPLWRIPSRSRFEILQSVLVVLRAAGDGLAVHAGVGAGAAVDRVGAGAGVDRVVAGAADQRSLP